MYAAIVELNDRKNLGKLVNFGEMKLKAETGDFPFFSVSRETKILGE